MKTSKAIERLKNICRQIKICKTHCLFLKDNEAIDLAISALQQQQNEPLMLEELDRMVGEPVWISEANKYGVIGTKIDHNGAVRYTIGFDYGWEWLKDVMFGDRKAYRRKP